MEKNKQKTFSNPFFWVSATFMLSTAVFGVTAFYFGTQNYQLKAENTKIVEENQENTENTRRAIAYFRQTLSKDSYDNALNFISSDGQETFSDFGEPASYVSGDATVEISATYAKKADDYTSSMISFSDPTLSSTDYDLYVVGVEVKNTGNVEVTVDPREFFLYSAADNSFLFYDSSTANDGGFGDGRQVVSKNSTETFSIFYAGEKGKNLDELRVAYGTQNWK